MSCFRFRYNHRRSYRERTISLKATAWRAGLTGLCAVLISTALTGCRQAGSRRTPSGSPSALPGDPNNGAQVFSQQGCTTCHGASLEGGIGAKLNPIQHFPGVANPLDPEYLRTTIRNGRSGDAGFSAQMPAFTPDKLELWQGFLHPCSGRALGTAELAFALAGERGPRGDGAAQGVSHNLGRGCSRGGF